jgi:LemA protein
MTGEQLAVLLAAAVVVFWMVGAYNRLMAMRNAIGAAWTHIDEALRQRAEVAAPLVQALRGPLAAEQGALDALLAAHGQASDAAMAMSARPLVTASAAAWLAAETALAAAASRVLALLEQHAELRATPPVAAAVATWGQVEARLAYTCQVFDAAAAAYNEAAAQLPTRWLLPLFRFEAAGRLRA